MGGAAVLVGVSVPLFPTESEEKVRQALSFLSDSMVFSPSSGVVGQRRLAGSSQDPLSLEKLRQKISERRIMDTARSRLLRNSSGDSTFLLLHKQALAAGRIALVDSDEESPLGAVEVRIEAGNLPDFINWLAPRTVDGIPQNDGGTPGEPGVQDP